MPQIFSNPIFIASWVIFSLICGIIGINRRSGFYGSFLLALVFSPVLLLIMLRIFKPVKPKKQEFIGLRCRREQNFLFFLMQEVVIFHMLLLRNHCLLFLIVLHFATQEEEGDTMMNLQRTLANWQRIVYPFYYQNRMGKTFFSWDIVLVPQLLLNV